MHESLQQLVFQWRQTPRLRMGVLLVCAIVAAYSLLLIADYRDRRLEELSRQQEHLLTLRSLSKQDQWPERAKQARVRRVKFEEKLWQAESRGLAQATIESWFNGQLAVLGLGHLKINTELAADVPGNRGLWQVTADLKGTVHRGRLVELLKVLELNEKLITIEQLSLKQHRTKGLVMQLQLRAWFQEGSSDSMGVK